MNSVVAVAVSKVSLIVLSLSRFLQEALQWDPCPWKYLRYRWNIDKESPTVMIGHLVSVRWSVLKASCFFFFTTTSKLKTSQWSLADFVEICPESFVFPWFAILFWISLIFGFRETPAVLLDNFPGFIFRSRHLRYSWNHPNRKISWWKSAKSASFSRAYLISFLTEISQASWEDIVLECIHTIVGFAEWAQQPNSQTQRKANRETEKRWTERETKKADKLLNYKNTNKKKTSKGDEHICFGEAEN